MTISDECRDGVFWDNDLFYVLSYFYAINP